MRCIKSWSVALVDLRLTLSCQDLAFVPSKRVVGAGRVYVMLTLIVVTKGLTEGMFSLFFVVIQFTEVISVLS